MHTTSSKNPHFISRSLVMLLDLHRFTLACCIRIQCCDASFAYDRQIPHGCCQTAVEATNMPRANTCVSSALCLNDDDADGMQSMMHIAAMETQYCFVDLGSIDICFGGCNRWWHGILVLWSPIYETFAL